MAGIQELDLDNDVQISSLPSSDAEEVRQFQNKALFTQQRRYGLG